ncbi:14-3-3-like protein [Antedon mediterranea]|uniref:14-3-3-like protein n=1 Tax=Antedon mediterranea TaxID=105859 RepID=UPI003AF59921
MDENEKYTYNAKLSEQSERYEDMVDQMKKLVEKKKTLTEEERNLLSVAYKNVIGGKRSAWRIVSSIGSKTEHEAAPKSELTQNYRKKIEEELNVTCKEVLDLLQDHLIPNTEEVESSVFYLKMKGDYHRYLAEFKSTEDRQACTEESLEAYKQALEKAKTQLAPTNPIRLGLALNFSVFYYEILNDPEKACTLAKTAFDEAMVDVEQDQQTGTYKDSTLIMQLLRDNLTLWTAESEDQDDDDTRVEQVQ